MPARKPDQPDTTDPTGTDGEALTAAGATEDLTVDAPAAVVPEPFYVAYSGPALDVDGLGRTVTDGARFKVDGPFGLLLLVQPGFTRATDQTDPPVELEQKDEVDAL